MFLYAEDPGSNPGWISMSFFTIKVFMFSGMSAGGKPTIGKPINHPFTLDLATTVSTNKLIAILAQNIKGEAKPEIWGML